jgi:hypothetical protein
MIMFTWQPFVLTLVLAPGFLLCPDRAVTAATSGARLFQPSCGITLQTPIQPHPYPSRRRHAASDRTNPGSLDALSQALVATSTSQFGSGWS